MKYTFFILAILFITGCSKPEFSGEWNGRCLQVNQDGEEYCFTTIRQAAIAMNTDYCVVRAIFINAQTRYMREVARERAREAARNDAER